LKLGKNENYKFHNVDNLVWRLLQRVPQYMIVSYLGVTKEFLSTILKTD